MQKDGCRGTRGTFPPVKAPASSPPRCFRRFSAPEAVEVADIYEGAHLLLPSFCSLFSLSSYPSNQSPPFPVRRSEPAVGSQISELITAAATLRTGLNEVALFKRMKLAECRSLTTPHHSSSRKESALR